MHWQTGLSLTRTYSLASLTTVSNTEEDRFLLAHSSEVHCTTVSRPWGGGEQANKGTRGRGRLSWLPSGAVVARLAPGSRPCLPCGRELGWEPPLVSTDTWHIPAHGRAYKSITLTHIKQYHYTTMSTVPQCFCSNRIWNVPRGSSVEGVALRVSQGSGGDSGSRFWGGVPEGNTGHLALTLCPQIPCKQTCFTKCSLLRCSASPHAQSDGIR